MKYTHLLQDRRFYANEIIQREKKNTLWLTLQMKFK